MRTGLLLNNRMYRKALLTVIFASDECTFHIVERICSVGNN